MLAALVSIILGLIITTVMLIGSVINPSEPVEETIIHHTIEYVEYDERSVETGIFTTKSEDREYLDVIYTDGETGNKETGTFQKERIKIADESELITEGYLSTLYLTEEEYIEHFFKGGEH